MTLSTIITAVIAGLISGILSPIIVSWFGHKFIWKKQKLLELKYIIFNDAVRALSLMVTDALDAEFQAEKSKFNGPKLIVALKPQTVELLDNAHSMVNAFFSEETFKAYDDAKREEISIKNIPYPEFERKRKNAILLMVKELGIL